MRHHYFLGFVVSIALVTAMPALAVEIETPSRIDAVTVYPDGATVTRLIRLDLPAGDSTLLARDFPLTLDPQSLRVEAEGAGRIVIGAVDARAPELAPPGNLPEIDRRLEDLRDQRAALDNDVEAATARRKFAQRFAETSPTGLGEKGEARPLSEWRLAFAAVAEEISAADGAIRTARIKQRDIDREIARLDAQRNANPPKKLEVRINMNADTPAPALLRVSYTVRSARWTPLYDARLDTGSRDRQPSLELVRRADVVQSSGEDWSDVALAVSTVRTARGGSAPDLRPLLVRYPFERPQQPAPAASMDALRQFRAPSSKANGEMFKKAEEQQAEMETGGFQVVFRIPGRISVSAGQGAKSFRVASMTTAPELMVHAVPALSETAFLQARFKQGEDAPLLPGRVAIYRDGVFVGNSMLALTTKDEMVRLGFGADEKVKIARAVVRRAEGTAGLIGSSKTDEREFKTTIRNGHDFPIRVAIEDQLPVSEIEDIQVEMLPVTTPPTARDLRDRRGVLEWAFEAKPGESSDLKFGWRVRWPKDKSVQYVPGA